MKIVYLESTESTMKDAAALAAKGEPHGTAVVAEQQTAGIGRHGHSWHSEAGAGLYLSLILRVNLSGDTLPVLTMALGVATLRAIEDAAAVRCDLRWPNDVLLNEKKIAGIMVQSADGALIAGIGINVNQREFPPELCEIATSLRIETGQIHPKPALLEVTIERALEYTRILETRGKPAIFCEFGARSSYIAGKTVEVGLDDRTIRGITAGLDDNGFLRVRTPTGTETVITGGVRSRAAL